MGRDRGRPSPAPPLAVLYISYDGALESLGTSQVVNYLLGLAKSYRILLMSFEKPADLAERARVQETTSALEAAGIRWLRLRYHKWPPVISSAFDVLLGIMVGVAAVVAWRPHVVHARGYLPSLVALVLKQLFGVKFVFDMRGFWADEKVDGGLWRGGSALYRMTKRCERQFFESADAIVSLTHASVKAFPELRYRIQPGIPIEVIPTCTDLVRFRPGRKDSALLARLGLERQVVIGCSGTMSNWYQRGPMLEYLAFLGWALPEARILIVTREDHVALRADAAAAGIPERRLVLARAAFAEMPDYLRLMDVGVFFIKVCFSKRGSAPTKLGEFLASGVPVIINDGIGDSGPIVRENDAGVVLLETTHREFEASLSEVKRILSDPDIVRRCRETARRYFDLQDGIAKYEGVCRRLVVAGRIGG